MHILVAEDDSFFRGLLEEVLREAGHVVECVSSGAKITQYLSFKSCDVLIFEMGLPDLNFFNLVDWCKKHRSGLKVVAMTENKSLLQIAKESEDNLSAFLSKPFGKEDLLSIMKQLGTVSSEGTQEDAIFDKMTPDGEFCRVSIDDFVSGKTIPFSIYLKISNSKYVKIAHTGEDVDLPRLKAYQAKHVSYLYLTRSDFRMYLSQGLRIAKNLPGAQAISSEKKAHFLRHTCEIMMENLMVNGVDKESFTAARNFVGVAIETVACRDDLVSLLTALNNHTDFLYAHSLGVALYGVMIAQQLGWRSTPTINTLMLCGLFHDIGLKEIDPELLNMPRFSLNQRQRNQVETHCARGAEIVSAVREIPLEVAQVAHQHHEGFLGGGYPNFLKKQQIAALSRLVTVADVFCYYVIKNPDQPQGNSAKEALQQMAQLRKDDIDPLFFGALKDSILAAGSQPSSSS